MRKVLLTTALMAGLGSLIAVAPASAAEQSAAGVATTAPATGYMQFHGGRQGGFNGRHGGFGGRVGRGGPGFGRGYYGRGYGGRGYYGRGYYGRGYGGGALVGGLAAGALLGGVIASQAAPVYQEAVPVYAPGTSEWVEYCSQKYRSFDPASGTYLGYDGLRHACE